MKELIPNARLVTIPNAGHIPMWENPLAFNEALLDFLREVDRLPVAGYELPKAFSWSIAGVVNKIAYWQTGTPADVVLVHGLGMSGAYLGHLARALFDRGLRSMAPDLRGFGESLDAPSLTPEEHAHELIEWADALSIRNAVWIGHSFGCNVIAHVTQLRPDLVREMVHVGPLWTRARHPMSRLLRKLLFDVFREPLSLYAYVIPAYWRTGLGRWSGTFHRSMPDIRTAPPPGLMIAGERDPLPDPATVTNIVRVSGAHACLFSNPAEVAETITRNARPALPPGSV
jgi:pimeloyl-ACP methyl ester carboxylesterase